ncbi:metal ABC transporter substrate-binding protein [Kribbella deserti]|uniref:Metal ABC transporter substrate-binding protein n=1 Tax=Kribbella deserti TaxID=1926257 RepID=A0ABV6QDU7_9ACTN
MRSRSFAFSGAVLAVTALASVTLVGCGDSGSANAAGDGAKLNVVASFYPLQFVAQQVGGDSVQVETLTAPGVEPHDLELTPKQVGTLADAKVVLFEKGLQPAVDEAVEQNAKDAGFDVSAAAKLEATGAEFEHEEEGEAHEGEEADGEEAHADELDPHFWLDPTKLADVADAVAGKLGEADAANADAYKQRAATLRAELVKLDGEFSTGLKNCERKAFVTSHEAFAYLAKRYGLEMVGIAGFTPDAEPTPARIKEVQDIVRKEKVTTIFYEELVSPKVAQSIASDLKVKTAVLSPIEGLSDANSNEDYFSLMRENLQELRKANGCA